MSLRRQPRVVDSHDSASALTRALSIGLSLKNTANRMSLKTPSTGMTCKPTFVSQPNRVSMCIRVGERYGELHMDPSMPIPDTDLDQPTIHYSTVLEYVPGALDFNTYDENLLMLRIAFPGFPRVEYIVAYDISDQEKYSTTRFVNLHTNRYIYPGTADLHYAAIRVVTTSHNIDFEDPYQSLRFEIEFHMFRSEVRNATLLDVVRYVVEKKVVRT